MALKKASFLIGAALAWAALFCALSGPRAEGPAAAPADLGKYDANAIIAKVQELMRGDSNYSEMKMTIYNPDWPGPRAYEMKSWEDKVSNRSFIRIISPASERGKAFMKDGNVFKVYIPTERENKPLTIPPSMMLQSWMGSDFSNDDLVHESSEINDYDHKVIGLDQGESGELLVKVEFTPKPEAPVVWGKIVTWVRVEDYIPVRYVYHDEDGTAVREMDLTAIKEMGGRKLPTVWEMKSLEPDQKGRRTLIEIEKIEFDIKIDPSTFTDKNLTRRDWD
ncbi:MAG TPA: outer membrane lipoprotein-sorting protein [bacterium]|nr:outer membrane lipoprotein-sorting protein [bacterium]